MVEWLAGNRIQGTSTERTSGTPEVPAISGGWKEVGRTTLGSAGDTISVSSLDDKIYYMVLTDLQASGYILNNTRLNSDTGSNYAWRRSLNGASDSTSASQTFISQSDTGAQEADFSVEYITNLSSKEKLTIAHVNENPSTGAGTAPTRIETVGKWANTSDAVSTITKFNSHSGNYDTGSECVVLGYDPDDTHTTNFWEQLASVDASGSSTNLSSGTITAKKYLWVQVYANDTSSLGFQFNNDTGSNYARRWSYNGGTDGTSTSQSSMNIPAGVDKTFTNMFIINNSATEKLCIYNDAYINGSGGSNDPERAENVGKWANTSAQITEIDVNKTGNFDSDSFIKVWGSN